MNSAIHELAKAVLKKPLHDCSLEELEHLTRQYPYFAPAQLLLAKKLSVEQNESPAYNEQVQRTSLYFPNRVWLDHLLNDYNSNSSDEVISRHHPLPMPVEESTVAEILIDESAKPGAIDEITTETAVEQTGVVNEIISEPIPPVAEQADNEINEPGDNDNMDKEEFPAPDLPAFEFSTLNNTTELANEKLIFEPYHTVDYFASQG